MSRKRHITDARRPTFFMMGENIFFNGAELMKRPLVTEEKKNLVLYIKQISLLYKTRNNVSLDGKRECQEPRLSETLLHLKFKMI